MANEWNGEYYDLCRDCHDYPCRCLIDEAESPSEPPTCPICETSNFFGVCHGCGYVSASSARFGAGEHERQGDEQREPEDSDFQKRVVKYFNDKHGHVAVQQSDTDQWCRCDEDWTDGCGVCQQCGLQRIFTCRLGEKHGDL